MPARDVALSPRVSREEFERRLAEFAAAFEAAGPEWFRERVEAAAAAATSREAPRWTIEEYQEILRRDVPGVDVAPGEAADLARRRDNGEELTRAEMVKYDAALRMARPRNREAFRLWARVPAAVILSRSVDAPRRTTAGPRRAPPRRARSTVAATRDGPARPDDEPPPQPLTEAWRRTVRALIDRAKREQIEQRRFCKRCNRWREPDEWSRSADSCRTCEAFRAWENRQAKRRREAAA